MTSKGPCAIAVAEAGASGHVGRLISESSRAESGVRNVAEEEDFRYLQVGGFDCLPYAVRAADDKIAIASEMFEGAVGNEGYFFDYRDGSRVHSSKILRMSMEELEDMRVAEEGHGERMRFVRESVRAADARVAALAVAFEESTENTGYVFNYRDGSRVHFTEYRDYGVKEKEDMQIAEEERLERMGYD